MSPTQHGGTAAGDWDPGSRIVIEHNSPVPLYFQVASQIEAAINSGELPVGSRLGNEIDMAGKLGLSRPTLRQAIGSLVDKGMLVRRRGAGTQVVFNKVKRPLELSSLYDDLAQLDQRPATQVLRNEIRPAEADVARALGVAEGTEIVHLERLRSAKEEPIARLRNYLPADLVALDTPELEQRGLYQMLRAAGIRLHAAHQSIGACAADGSDAKLLDERKGAPLLTMERTTYDQQGRVVEYGTHVYRASRYSFDLSLRGDV